MPDWIAKAFQAAAYISMATYYVVKTIKECRRKKRKRNRKKG
jgi:hypothetical protein